MLRAQGVDAHVSKLRRYPPPELFLNEDPGTVTHQGCSAAKIDGPASIAVWPASHSRCCPAKASAMTRQLLLAALMPCVRQAVLRRARGRNPLT